MKNFFLLMVPVLIFINVNTQAQECCNNSKPCCAINNNFYVEVLGGANFLQTDTNSGIRYDYQTGYIVSGSLGYRWCYGLRFEAEYAFRRNSLRKIHFLGRTFTIDGHFESSSYMANLLWDFPLSNWGCNFLKIQPYIGGGAGYDFQQVRAHNEGFSFRENKKHFAWQVIAGLGYPLLCNTDISLEYKFHKGGFNYIYSHSVGLGLTYRFGRVF